MPVDVISDAAADCQFSAPSTWRVTNSGNGAPDPAN